MEGEETKKEEIPQGQNQICIDEGNKLPLSGLQEHDEQVWKDYHEFLEDEETHAKHIETHVAELCAAEEGEIAHHKSHKHHSPKENQALLEIFNQELQALEIPDAKLSHALDFMEKSISQSGMPNFKCFWEARKLCIEFFKDEAITPVSRAHLWNRYVELSKEARRLKDILDEQSSFAAEQIEMAIQALEQEIQQIPALLQKPSHVDLPNEAKILKQQKDTYELIQKELNLLNAYASRINALRKELIKTEMRIRIKHKFFQRLSLAGDQIFPRRKDLIRDISQLFMSDIDSFIKRHFEESFPKESLFILREEIKALQQAAKIFTLNTQSFTLTRTKLSECWDKIKILEKDRKKEKAKHRQLLKQHALEIEEKIKALKQQFLEQNMSVGDANAKIQEIQEFMRAQPLDRDEVQQLKKELQQIRSLVNDKMRVEEEQRDQVQKEKEKARQEKIAAFKTKIELLLKKAETVEDTEELLKEKELYLDEIKTNDFNKFEKIELEKLLKPMNNLIADKKEKALLSLSEDDRNTLDLLYQVLEQRKEQRQEIREQIRKASGTSGLDFQQAMAYNEMLNEEKKQLDKINQNIKNLELKITEVESKL